MTDGDDVLDTLVKQFTDPFACLRELIQNAVDAGSDVVEVRCFREGVHGVIEVLDHGEGMDKAVIETRLVRLFASNKDGDLTKIGKFGIGFVSVFALNPVAVCVDTARAGERWRIVFHPDRSWTRAVLDEAMQGTRVRVFVETDPAGFEALRRNAEAAVRKWCRHLEAEILVDGVAINEVLSLPACPLSCTRTDGDGTTVLVGLSDGDVSIGFYNKGLTLFETAVWPDLPAGVSVRLSSRWLEHTLTRDSIVKDAHYDKAIAMARDVVDVDLEAAALKLAGTATPAVRSPVLRWLADRAQRPLRKRKFLADTNGTLHAPASLAAPPPMLVVDGSPSSARVAAAASAAGHVVIAVSASHTAHDTEALARLIGVSPSALIDVEATYVAALAIDGARGARARRLADATARLLKAVGGPPNVQVASVVGRQARGRLSYLTNRALALTEQPFALAVVDGGAPGSSMWRKSNAAMVIDIDHSDIDGIFALSATDTWLAAMLLVRLVSDKPMTTEHNAALAEHAWKAWQESEAP